MKLFIGADHRGFKDKEIIKAYLAKKGYDVIDKGAFELDPEDDYPDFAFAVAEAVAEDRGSKGILLCGSSNGVSVSANKVRGIFSSQVRSVKEAEEDIKHHNSNIVALSADQLSGNQMKEILDAWFGARFDGGRHKRRLDKIKLYEAKIMTNSTRQNLIKTEKRLIIILLFTILLILSSMLVNYLLNQKLLNMENQADLIERVPDIETTAENDYKFTCKNRQGQCFGPQTTGVGYIFCDNNQNPQGASDCGPGGPNIPFCTREGVGNHCDGENIIRCDAKGALEYAIEICNNKCDGATDKCIGGGRPITGNNPNPTPTPTPQPTFVGTPTPMQNGCGYPSSYSFVDFTRDNRVNIDDFVCFVREYRTRQ